MAKEKKKYHKDGSRSMSKHKKITLADGTKCELLALAFKNEKGRLRCQDVAADFFIKDIDFKTYFNIRPYENPERRIDLHFKNIKKRIEESNPNIILVMTYATNFTETSNKSGVMCNLALHIEEEEFSTSTLDRQPILTFLVERTIKEVRDSFLQT